MTAVSTSVSARAAAAVTLRLATATGVWRLTTDRGPLLVDLDHCRVQAGEWLPLLGVDRPDGVPARTVSIPCRLMLVVDTSRSQRPPERWRVTVDALTEVQS